MTLRLKVGQITDPKDVLVDGDSTVDNVIAQYNLTGEITHNGAAISQNLRKKTLSELGFQDGDYLCSARKNGGN